MYGVLGTRLKKARTELGLSQAAFARALGFPSEFTSLLSLYHPREKFAQTFAACFLMPASKVRATIEKEFGGAV
jgi:transcriptional regulator with XRE-family HTH domain